MTPARRERQEPQNRNHGKYAAFNPCEICGKSTGANYCSHPQCNAWGLGVVLCDKCGKKLEAMPDAEARALLEQKYAESCKQ